MKVSKTANNHFNIRTQFAGFNHQKTRTLYNNGRGLSFYKAWATDEGYSYTHEHYRIVDGKLCLTVDHGGRDCDGEIHFHNNYVWYASKRKFHRIDSSQRDYEAEKAGY